MDYWMAGLWGIVASTVMKKQQDEPHHQKWSWIFLGGAASVIIAILFYNTGVIARIRATFVNPNDYATFALMMFFFGLYCFEREIHPKTKLLVATVLAVLIFTVAMSYSRGIFLAIVVVGLVTLLKKKPGKVIAILFIVLVAFTAFVIMIRFRQFEEPKRYYRWKIWQSSLRGILDDPYFGVGLGMLEYSAKKFNFPGDSILGRYSQIARSADSQYVEILAETGFVGFFLFVFGWIGLLFSLQKSSPRFFYVKQFWLIVTVTGLFSLPLQNTSASFLAFFLGALAVSDSDNQLIVLPMNRLRRILIPILCFVILVFGVYLPFQAHREFQKATAAKDFKTSEAHLAKALRYNPYQPYYRFTLIRRIVDAKPQFDSSKWLLLVSLLDQSIRLNPTESEFYRYKARILQFLLEQKRTLAFYSSAVSAYQSALDYNPYNVFLRLEYAAFLNRFSRFHLAEQQIRKALEYEPVYLSARLFLVDVLLSEAMFEQARREYLKFEEYNNRFKSFAARSTSYSYLLLKVDPQFKKRVEERLNKS
jgi:O-Antigen ligase